MSVVRRYNGTVGDNAFTTQSASVTSDSSGPNPPRLKNTWASAASYVAWAGLSGLSVHSGMFALELGGAPTVTWELVAPLQTGGTRHSVISLTAAAKLRVRNAANTTVGADSTTTLAVGSVYYILWTATTTNVTVYIYDSSGNLLETMSRTDTYGADLVQARVGNPSGSLASPTFYIDDLRISSLSNTSDLTPFLPTPVDLTPTVSAGTDQSVSPGASVTVTAAPSGGNTPLTVGWAQVSGPAVSITVVGNNGTFTAPSTPGSVVVLRATVTDADGDIDTDDVAITVTAPPSSIVRQWLGGDPNDTAFNTVSPVVTTDTSGPRPPRLKSEWVTGGAAYVAWTGLPGYAQHAGMFSFQVDALGSAWDILTALTTGGARHFEVAITSGGGLRVRGADNIAIGATSTTTLTPGQVYYILWRADATNVTLYIYDGDGTLLETMDRDGTFAASLVNLRIGNVSTSVSSPTFYVDDVRLSTLGDTTDLVPLIPVIDAVPVIDAGPDQSAGPGVTISLSAAAAAGTAPLSVSWSQVGGPAVTIVGTGADVTFDTLYRQTPYSVTLRATVTDADGDTAADDITVTVSAHDRFIVTSTGLRPLIMGDTPLPPPPAGNTALEQYLPAGNARRPGFYVQGSDLQTAWDWSLEGSRADVVLPDIKAYYTLANSAVPSALHKTIAAAGHPIHAPVALNGPTAAVPSRGLPAPALISNGKGIWTYQQITDGLLDDYWEWLAAQFIATDNLIVFSLNIEPESVSTTTGRRESFSNPLWYVNRATLGDAAVRVILREYAAAYRYVRAKLTALGVTNVIYSMNFAALGYVSAWHNTNVYPSMYPGDDVVDMLGWDPYVNNPASQSFAQKLQSTLTYINGGGFDSSFYPGTGVKTKPWHLPEFGCTPTTDAAAIAWINQIPAALASVPNLRAICWFSSPGTENTRIDTIPAVRAAWAEKASDPIFQPVRGPA